jgi:CheY-like chemotaxis protein
LLKLRVIFLGLGLMINVLHVDDDRISFEITRIGIRRFTRDIQVTWIKSAREALEHLKENSYDCIVSDFQMPEMDGLEFLKEVRKEFQYLPFIILSGQSEEKKAVDALKAGCSDYFTKEINIAHFQRLAHSIIKQVEAEEYHALGEKSSQKVNKYSALVNTLLNSRDIGYCIFDVSGNIETSNGIFEKTLHIKPDQMIRSIDDIFSYLSLNSTSNINFNGHLHQISAENQPVGPHEITLKNGRVIEWSSTPMVSGSVLQGHLLTFKDVTATCTLKREVKSLMNFMDHSNNQVIRVGEGGIILAANRCSSILINKWKTTVGGPLPLKLQNVVSKCLASGQPIEMLESFGKNTLLLQLNPFPELGHVTIYGMDLNRDSKILDSKIQELLQLWRQTKEALGLNESKQKEA